MYGEHKTDEEFDLWLKQVEEYKLAREMRSATSKEEVRVLEERERKEHAEERARNEQLRKDNTEDNVTPPVGLATDQSEPKEATLEDSLANALNIAGGSNSEKARIIQEMLASLNEVVPVSTSDDPQPEAKGNDDVASTAREESRADEATATMTMGIPNSNANNPPDLAEGVRAPIPAQDGTVGVETGQGNDLSVPG